MNRRHFLMGTGLTALARTARSSPNDTIRVACIGVGDPDIGVKGQGHVHLLRYSEMQNVEVATICDVDRRLLSYGQDLVEKAGRKKPSAVVDYRRVLDDKTVDAVSIATPDHHHALEEGALSVTLMHLANISYKLGRSLNINPATGDAIGDPEALHLYRRQQYRAPFIVPEKV